MTNDCWLAQKTRLIDRFGEKNFSREFSLLVAIECNSMPDDAFVQLVNVFIGSRRPSDPPLIANFRDGRIAWERRQFERDVHGATRAWNEPARFQGLRAYLTKHFPGCKSVKEAVEVRKLQIELKRADDPAYEPLADKAWMGAHAHTRSATKPEGMG